eukprot:TRINITY_DN2969_c2_g2_i7.p1 TRINITY_DN2969_c2_g2~~TRINITY_DN2969_c2_g2_i7.p1  ORF type:complete len:187 (+),score=51.53 TRINITY_DN2969_c2_g2_i7:57-617(+)
MRAILSSQTVEIPENVTIEVKNRVVRVTGPRGVLVRDFKHVNAQFTIKNAGRTFEVAMFNACRKRVAALRAIRSHILNMITGVTKGYRYTVVEIHRLFPMTIAPADNGKSLHIQNFMHNLNTIKIAMPEGVVCVAGEKSYVHIEGNDLQLVSETAHRCNMATKVRDKDMRKFLDGVYVSSVGHIDN